MNSARVISGAGRADVLLQQVHAVDRRLVIRAVEIVGERVGGLEQPHAEPLAAAVRLQDERAAGKALPRRCDQQLLAGDQHGVRRADAGGFEGGVLARLADFEVERAAAVDDAAAVPLEPGQHRRRSARRRSDGRGCARRRSSGCRRRPRAAAATGRRRRGRETSRARAASADRAPRASGSSQAAFSWITWIWVIALLALGLQ